MMTAAEKIRPRVVEKNSAMKFSGEKTVVPLRDIRQKMTASRISSFTKYFTARSVYRMTSKLLIL